VPGSNNAEYAECRVIDFRETWMIGIKPYMHQARLEAGQCTDNLNLANSPANDELRIPRYVD